MVRWPVKFDRESVFEELRSAKVRSVHTVVGHLLLKAASLNGADVALDKSLDGVHYTEEYLASYPGLKFINIVRDPRAQISSMNKAIIHDFDTLLNAITWVKAHESADERIRRTPDKVLTIRFEDFILDHEKTLRSVCKFLEIDFDDSMLDIKNSSLAKKISTMSALWENNAKNPDTESLDKYQKSLSEEEIRLIEQLCGKWMERYGYEFRTNVEHMSVEDIPKDQIEAAVARSEARKVEAWEDLRCNDRYPEDYALRKRRAEFLDQCRERLQRRSNSSS